MSLGNNRDYKTAGRRAVNQLAKHAELMKRYEAEGLSREDASKKALAELEKKSAKDGILSGMLKGAAVLMALLYLSRIPQQPVEYDLTKYQPPQRAWDEGYDPAKLTATLRQGDTLVLNQDVLAKRSGGKTTAWKAGKKFWVVSSITDPTRKQGMLRVAPAGASMGGAVAFTDQQIQSYFR